MTTEQVQVQDKTFEPKAGDWRFMAVVLRAGQGRAYQDTIHTYRVTFEIMSYPWQQEDKKAPPTWIPCPWGQPVIMQKLKCIFPWVEKGHPDENWASPKLDYVKEVSKGIWEFQVRTPYTD